MQAEYIIITQDFINHMKGKRSSINTEIVFTSDITNDGRVVCVAWYEPLFPEDFTTIAIHKQFISAEEFH